MNKLQAEITRRAAERGQQGAKKLVDMIIGNLDASLSSGLFTETDAVSVKQLKLDLKEGILEPLISAYSFFPRPQVAKELGTTIRTICRYETEKRPGFDRPVKIGGRVFHPRSRIEAVKILGNLVDA